MLDSISHSIRVVHWKRTNRLTGKGECKIPLLSPAKPPLDQALAGRRGLHPGPQEGRETYRECLPLHLLGHTSTPTTQHSSPYTDSYRHRDRAGESLLQTRGEARSQRQGLEPPEFYHLSIHLLYIFPKIQLLFNTPVKE